VLMKVSYRVRVRAKQSTRLPGRLTLAGDVVDEVMHLWTLYSRGNSGTLQDCNVKRQRKFSLLCLTFK